MNARRHRLTSAVAAAFLGLCLTGCGSHHDNTEPNLHGVGPTQDNPAAGAGAATDTGNHSGLNSGGSTVITSTGNPTAPDANGNSTTLNGGSTMGNGGSTMGNGGSTSTRATPGSANGFLPQNSGGGVGSMLGSTPGP